MIDWKKCVYGDKVRIIDAEGDAFDGVVQCITSVEERSDLEIQEDGIGIITDDGRHIEFYQSEIAEVQIIQAA